MSWAKQLRVSPLSTVYGVVKETTFICLSVAYRIQSRAWQTFPLFHSYSPPPDSWFRFPPAGPLSCLAHISVLGGFFPVCSTHSFHQMLLHHPYARARDKRPPHIIQARIPTATEPGSHPPCEMLPGAFSGHSVPTMCPWLSPQLSALGIHVELNHSST